MTPKTPWKPTGQTLRNGSTDSPRSFAKRTNRSLPRLVGDGPPTFSPSLAVDVMPRFIWDTNRFYHDLGVPTNASRAEIGRAYLEKNGHASVRLTKIVKTLLDPQARSRYDCTPFGCFWADDEALWPRVVRGEDDDQVGALKVVRWDQSVWAVYAWDVTIIDFDLLDEWRSALAVAWNEHGLPVLPIAVGVCHRDIEPQILVVGFRIVAFVPQGLASKEPLDYARSILGRVTDEERGLIESYASFHHSPT